MRLRRGEPTVRNYLIRIFDKLGIFSRVELVLYAFSGTELRELRNILRVRVNDPVETAECNCQC